MQYDVPRHRSETSPPRGSSSPSPSPNDSGPHAAVATYQFSSRRGPTSEPHRPTPGGSPPSATATATASAAPFAAGESEVGGAPLAGGRFLAPREPGDSARSTSDRTDSRFLQPGPNIARRVASSPVLLLPVGSPPLFCRLASFFDLTLPMHETFGEDGSTAGGSDLPADPDHFGKNPALPPALPGRRLFASTKHDFCGFGRPSIEALDLKLDDDRRELELLGELRIGLEAAAAGGGAGVGLGGILALVEGVAVEPFERGVLGEQDGVGREIGRTLFPTTAAAAPLAGAGGPRGGHGLAGDLAVAGAAGAGRDESFQIHLRHRVGRGVGSKELEGAGGEA
ncbi:hypothetical protein NL676_016560 [Syzygium grande]|nr:hypothetical protein NL676_016560 [Syzygium grande]